MEFRAVLVNVIIFCMYIGFQDNLVIAQIQICTYNGGTCQIPLDCCDDVKCIKPPHTCNGVCNQYSCSGDGPNRPEGAQCNDYTDCDQTAAPIGGVIPCERPKDKTCNGLCPLCAVPL